MAMKFMKAGMLFTIGLLLAAVATLMPSLLGASTTAMILVILGVVGGFISGFNKDMILAGIALAVVTVSFSAIPVIGMYLSTFLQNLTLFIAPLVLVSVVMWIIKKAKK